VTRVYARDGVASWDGEAGLLLESNELENGLGAGLFLHEATATLSGNSYADNAVDLVTQGSGCEEPPAGYEGEAFRSDVQLCPAYDYATCGDEFRLYMTLAEPGSGYGAAVARRPGPGTPPPSMPSYLAKATRLGSPLPLAMPARWERTPPIPFVGTMQRPVR